MLFGSSRSPARVAAPRCAAARSRAALTHGHARAQEGWSDPGTFHHAKLTHLPAGRRIFYKFGSRQHGFSREFSFLAPPEAGPGAEVSIVMLADMGEGQVRPRNLTAFLFLYSFFPFKIAWPRARCGLGAWPPMHDVLSRFTPRQPCQASLTSSIVCRGAAAERRLRMHARLRQRPLAEVAVSLRQ